MSAAEKGRPVVLICRDLRPAGRTLIARECDVRVGGLDATPSRLRELAPGALVLVADPTVVVDADLLHAAGEALRLVANFAVGFDNVDVEECRRRRVAVSNTPDVLTDATAELALALTLAAARRLWEAGLELREGRWEGWDPSAHLGEELSGACFAVIGLGRIGTRYAELVRPLAGRLVYASPRRRPEVEARLGIARLELEQALEVADVVSVHAPANAETLHMFGAPQFAAMKPESVLVNTARGSLVDSAALAAALHAGQIGAAGLDVYEHEPRVPQALLEAPRCVLSPHIGSATRAARDAMSTTVAANVLAVVHGGEPPNRVA